MFTFDHAYDCNSCQEDIFDECAQPLVQNVMEGYNGTIFAYGQTGTGKTHTMTGQHDQLGIVPRAFTQIFAEIGNESSECKYLLRASYLEIYNEDIRDLLSKDPKKKLYLHEKPATGVYVKQLSVHVVKDVDSINKLLDVGMKNRAVGSTKMNDVSSRSHALF